MYKKTLSLILLAFAAMTAVAEDEIVCPPESAIKAATLNYAIEVPHPIPLPMVDKDYVAVGNISSDNRVWYVSDGLFSHVDSEREALMKGQAYLMQANPPQGPYHKYFDAWGCVYYASMSDQWDRRPKFIIAVTGRKPEYNSLEDILTYVDIK